MIILWISDSLFDLDIFLNLSDRSLVFALIRIKSRNTLTREFYYRSSRITGRRAPRTTKCWPVRTSSSPPTRPWLRTPRPTVLCRRSTGWGSSSTRDTPFVTLLLRWPRPSCPWGSIASGSLQVGPQSPSDLCSPGLFVRFMQNLCIHIVLVWILGFFCILVSDFNGRIVNFYYFLSSSVFPIDWLIDWFQLDD